jgi:hypothetical protein
VILLDENINQSQLLLLRSWRIRAHLIGQDISRKGIQDEQIIPLLHGLSRPTFFTRDVGFYDHELCHVRYCIVFLAVHRYEAASFIRRFLRHAAFRTRANRMGRVVRVSSAGVRFWQIRGHQEEFAPWA